MSDFEILDSSRKERRFDGLCALGIMTKAPEAGRVKTRLTPPLTPAEAAAINSCFLRDVSSSVAKATREAGAMGVGVYTPVGSESSYTSILPDSFLLIPQRGDGFGERLTLAIEDLLAVGFASACLINSDSPTVSASHFVEAARELAKPGEKIVIGPSEDGGYYLVGMRRLHRRLFEEIDWSTERVLEQTRMRAREIEVEVHELQAGFDVDDGATLGRLCDELLDPQCNSGLAPSSHEFLQALIEREGRNRIWPQV